MTITPALHVKNEEYWIAYVLRNVLGVFGCAIMIDTGSTDRTVDIARAIAERTGADLTLVCEDMQNDPEQIGRCSTRLREMVTTPWMLLVDGDEIYSAAALETMLRTVPDPEKYDVGMVNGRNLMLVNEISLAEREGFAADRLFSKNVSWDMRTDYPFQSHDLEARCRSGRVSYFSFEEVYFWHTRHLVRSSKDEDAFFRTEKIDYFAADGGPRGLPDGWLGSVESEWPNPYLNGGAA